MKSIKIKKSGRKQKIKLDSSNLLIQSEETFLIGCLIELINFEKEVEILKINIALKPEFNLMDAYSILDRDCHSEITPSEL